MNYYTHKDQIALIIHDSYGAGWYSQHGIPELAFDPKLAQALDSQDRELATARINELAAEHDVCAVRAQDLVVEWVTRGRKFMIHEYDGWETLWYKDQIRWVQA